MCSATSVLLQMLQNPLTIDGQNTYETTCNHFHALMAFSATDLDIEFKMFLHLSQGRQHLAPLTHLFHQIAKGLCIAKIYKRAMTLSNRKDVSSIVPKASKAM